MWRDVIFPPDSIEFEGELMSVFYLFSLEFFGVGEGIANVRFFIKGVSFFLLVWFIAESVGFFVSISFLWHRGESYNLFEHNCNTFSNEVAQFLTGKKIPSYITDLPSEVLSTWVWMPLLSVAASC